MKDEYIRKKDAIDAVNHALDRETLLFSFVRKVAISALKGLPSADVAPVVHGKWIDHDGNKVQLNEHGETCGTCFCSRCGEWLVASDEYAVKGYFCPNCGAKMDAQG